MGTSETAHTPGGLQQQQQTSIGARQEEDNPTCDSRDIPRGGSAAGGTRKADDHSRVDDEEVSPRDGLVAGDEWGAAR